MKHTDQKQFRGIVGFIWLTFSGYGPPLRESGKEPKQELETEIMEKLLAA